MRLQDPEHAGDLLHTLRNVAQGRMQPLPRHVSLGCTSLVARALVRDPQSRIALQDIAADPWLLELGAKVLCMLQVLRPKPSALCPELSSYCTAPSSLCALDDRATTRDTIQTPGCKGAMHALRITPWAQGWTEGAAAALQAITAHLETQALRQGTGYMRSVLVAFSATMRQGRVTLIR